MERLLARFICLLIVCRWPLLAAALLIGGAAYPAATRVHFDRSIENMFAPGDPLLAPYQRLKAEFGGNEVVMAVYRDPELLAADGAGLVRLGDVSRRMKQVTGVRDVLSLAQVNDLLEQLEASKPAGLLRLLTRERPQWAGPAILNPDSPLAAKYRELFAGYTHSADGQVAAVVCMLEPAGPLPPGDRQPAGDNPAPTADIAPATDTKPTAADPGPRSRAATIAALERIVRDLPGGLAPGVLAGEPVMVVEGFSLLEADGRRLGRWSLVLLGLTILLCFRSVRWFVAPLAVVQWSLLVTQATIVWAGLQLSMVSSMLTAIVTVVGVATVVHLIVRYRELAAAGRPPAAALAEAGVLLAGPILGAILTDVVGFGSLWGAHVGPVQDFGTMMMIGSALVIPAVCLLVPAIALAGLRERPPSVEPPPASALARGLAHSIEVLQARRLPIALGGLLGSLVVAFGALRLEVESDFTRNFRSGSRIVAAYEFVESHLGGAGVWDVIIPAPATLTNDYLDRVQQFQQALRAIRLPAPAGEMPQPGLTKVLSLVDALQAVEVDPALALASAELRYQGIAAAMPAFTAALVTPAAEAGGSRRLRIMLRARERQPASQKQWLIDEVARLAQEAFPAEGAGDDAALDVAAAGTSPRDTGNAAPPAEAVRGAEVTGFFVLLTHLIESILRDQWTTFGIASAGIFLMLLAAFRSLKLALIALVPNALPIFVVMGLMGWITLLGLAELKINMGAAMIAAVSMGLSVDSSIHYLTAYRRERRGGKTVSAALASVQQSVGEAMLLSTISLVVGFLVLCSSEFVPTVYFGALVSLAMFGGLLGNLVILPLLLLLVEQDAPGPPAHPLRNSTAS